jgi:hypothetical protein
MLGKKKHKKPWIKFSSPIPGIIDSELVRPQLAKNFIPDGWKGVPNKMEAPFPDPNDKYKYIGKNEMVRTSKTCPSFIDVFNHGYVIPAPCDIYLQYNKEKDVYHYETAIPDIPIVIHSQQQYLAHLKNPQHEFIFKLDNVWCIETPKGYSIQQLPMFWHHNPDWETAMGILHTDQFHQINIQLMLKKDCFETLIKQGDPLCYVIPYKRLDFEHEYAEFNIKKLITADFNNLGTFAGTAYRKYFNRNKDNG